MTFRRLIQHELGGIILVNLHETVAVNIIPADVQTEALKRIQSELGRIDPATPASQLPDAFYKAMRAALLKEPTLFQVQATQSPPTDISLTAIVAFDKIKGILEKLNQRTRRFQRIIETIKAPYAPEATVAKAAGLINEHAARNSDITLSDWGTIFWAAPSREIERLIDTCAKLSGKATNARIARYLRDALGLVHLDFGPLDDNRHLFIMRGQVPLDVINREHDFSCARPTTFDGWDNRRFCQPMLIDPPRVAGCGMTIDIAEHRVAPGAAEVVSTPIPMKHFRCEYLGPVEESEIGKDADYYRYILAGRDPHELADRLVTAAGK